MFNSEMARIASGIRHRHANSLNAKVELTTDERTKVETMCRKRRARLEIREPNDKAWSTLKVLDLGDNASAIASTRMKLRHTWYAWCLRYPEGTDWRIRYDVF